ncbi:MAG: hypothetical protein DCC67_17040 [Planctomycetota bacterium]|nr:MAG: hypothetical protein DCC67_17040 [Planctomycetota bacterium]
MDAQEKAFGDDGTDAFVITAAIDTLSGIVIDGGEGADSAHLIDSSSWVGSVSYSNGTLVRGISPVATIENVASFYLTLGAGINSLKVLGVRPGVTLDVTQLNSSDIVDIGDPDPVTARGLDTILGNVRLSAPNTNDAVAIRLHDEFAPSGRNFAMSVVGNETRISRPGFGTVTVVGFGVSSIDLYAGGYNDVVEVDGTKSGASTTINLGAGDDNVTIGTSTSLSSIAGPLTIAAGAGDDTIRFRYGSRGSSTPAISAAGGDGSDTFRIDSPGNSISLAGVSLTDTGTGSVDLDHFDISGNALTSMGTYGSVTGIESLDASDNQLSTLSFPSGLVATGLTSLDLRYNDLDLAATGILNPLSALSDLSSLLLYGNDYPLVERDAGNPIVPRLNALDAIKGKLLRIDLPPIGLDLAESISTEDDAVAGIARALHYLPLEIYEYVLNNYEYHVYAGRMKCPASVEIGMSGWLG